MKSWLAGISRALGIGSNHAAPARTAKPLNPPPADDGHQALLAEARQTTEPDRLVGYLQRLRRYRAQPAVDQFLIESCRTIADLRVRKEALGALETNPPSPAAVDLLAELYTSETDDQLREEACHALSRVKGYPFGETFANAFRGADPAARQRLISMTCHRASDGDKVLEQYCRGLTDPAERRAVVDALAGLVAGTSYWDGGAHLAAAKEPGSPQVPRVGRRAAAIRQPQIAHVRRLPGT